MSNPKKKWPKSKGKAKNDHFVELLLNVVVEYKIKKTAENVDWELGLEIKPISIETITCLFAMFSFWSAKSTRCTGFELLRHRFQIVFKRIRRQHGST